MNGYVAVDTNMKNSANWQGSEKDFQNPELLKKGLKLVKILQTLKNFVSPMLAGLCVCLF